jgi:hypothetical protein
LEDEWGQVGRKYVLVYVYLPDPPEAVISYDGWAVVNETEQFNGTSRGTNITYWNWSVEHNGTVQWYDNGTTVLFTYVFTEVHQIYNLTLNVTDEWGQSNRTVISILTHYTSAPDINWTNKPTVGFVGKSLRYSFTTQNISLVVWTWGDGSTSTGYTGNMSHTWHRWGTFNVTMTIYNIHGDANSSNFQVNIGIFDWNSFMHNLWWILLIIIIILVVKMIVKFLQMKGENDIDI